jgi:hypothetical protein
MNFSFITIYNTTIGSDVKYFRSTYLIFSTAKCVQNYSIVQFSSLHFHRKLFICWSIDGRITSAMGVEEEVFSVPTLAVGVVPMVEVAGVQDILPVGLLCQQLAIPILVEGVLFVEIRHTLQMFAQTVETDAPPIMSYGGRLHVALCLDR